jgi:prephenate dehydratase
VHLGATGSFTHQAARLFAERRGLVGELCAFRTSSEVLAELARGEADFAVLPLANSTVGLVAASLSALAACSQPLELVAELALPVRFALLARRADLALGRVRGVASHPLALAQCERALTRLLPGCRRIPWSDTASAACALAAGEFEEDTAVLAAPEVAELHGLVALCQDLQDEPGNRTFFGLFRRAGAAAVD